jgi:outer membrane protein TolC
MVFDELYTDPIDKQLILLGFDIPIVDWGRSKAQIRTAEANKKLIDVMVLQDEQSFKQEIYLAVRRFNIYRQNLFIAEKADQVAQKRYAVTFSRYMIGKVVTLDLKDAQEEKDLSRRAYIRALSDAWNSYYELRQKTLYDFDRKMLIKE